MAGEQFVLLLLAAVAAFAITTGLLGEQLLGFTHSARILH